MCCVVFVVSILTYESMLRHFLLDCLAPALKTRTGAPGCHLSYCCVVFVVSILTYESMLRHRLFCGSFNHLCEGVSEAVGVLSACCRKTRLSATSTEDELRSLTYISTCIKSSLHEVI